VLCLALTATACGELAGDAAVSADPAGSPSAGPSGQSSAAAADGSATPSASPGDGGGSAGGRAGAETTVASGWGPTTDELRRARRLVARMPLPDLAGQVIVARYRGTRSPVDLVNRLHLGGVIMMDGNIAGSDAVRRSNRRLQRSVRDAGRGWPAFIGVDQEGGLVERVRGTATRFPSFMTAGAGGRARLTRAAAAASAGELRHLGFTTVFAPDADVTTGPSDPTIGSRSASSSPRRAARQVIAAFRGHATTGIVPVAKHFPGHGSVPADSHDALPVQRRSLRRLMESDLVPFRQAVDAGIPAVMSAHIDVRAVDPGVPASLSRPVVTGLLRQRLGFRGLVVTDALEMGAVADRFSSGQAAVRALRAGNDVLLMPADTAAARAGIVEAVRGGTLRRARLEEAAARQVALLLHQQAVGDAGTRPPGSSRAASYRFSREAVTVVSGPCRGRLVGRSVRVSGESEAARRLRVAARRAGLETGSGTSVALVGYRGSPATADVVVSTDTPYVLRRSVGRTARIALFGDTPGAMRALVDVLLGRRPAPGRLPVPVADVPRRGC
jgi:beta-N-acetylhexosaminidase